MVVKTLDRLASKNVGFPGGVINDAPWIYTGCFALVKSCLKVGFAVNGDKSPLEGGLRTQSIIRPDSLCFTKLRAAEW